MHIKAGCSWLLDIQRRFLRSTLSLPFLLSAVQENTVIYPGTQVTELIKITTRQDVLRPGME